MLPLSSRRQTKAVVPNLFGTRDKFYGKQFFHGLGVVVVVVVVRGDGALNLDPSHAQFTVRSTFL